MPRCRNYGQDGPLYPESRRRRLVQAEADARLQAQVDATLAQSEEDARLLDDKDRQINFIIIKQIKAGYTDKCIAYMVGCTVQDIISIRTRFVEKEIHVRFTELE